MNNQVARQATCPAMSYYSLYETQPCNVLSVAFDRSVNGFAFIPLYLTLCLISSLILFIAQWVVVIFKLFL